MKRILGFILVLVMSLYFVGCGNSNRSIENHNKDNYDKALQCIEAADYAGAISLLEKVDSSYKDTTSLIEKVRYTYGCILFNQQAYHDSAVQFSLIKNYRNATELWEDSWKYCGYQHIEQRKYSDAIAAFNHVTKSERLGLDARKLLSDLYGELFAGDWSGTVTVSGEAIKADITYSHSSNTISFAFWRKSNSDFIKRYNYIATSTWDGAILIAKGIQTSSITLRFSLNDRVNISVTDNDGLGLSAVAGSYVRTSGSCTFSASTTYPTISVPDIIGEVGTSQIETS